MIGSLEVKGKHYFVDLKDEEADKEDYIHNGRNDQAAVLNVYQLFFGSHTDNFVQQYGPLYANTSQFGHHLEDSVPCW